MTSPVVWQLDGQLLDVLTELEVGFERVEAGAYVLTLVGARRPSTLVWLIAGEQAVSVEAFVMYVVDVTDPAPLHRYLLARNLRLRDVHFGLDDVGDVFLTGSLPHAAVDAVTLDRLLGEVLQLLEDSRMSLVELAYGDRLEREPTLAAKVLVDGAGRRPAGTPDWAPRRDVRR
ncbi:MAG: YbjN domain-containing protein [Frankiaceae bacterium]|nr:YbjN domain-containing protein [Frankiaceae bacterium]